jgi:GNAT superfamily N-acetyltransferase
MGALAYKVASRAGVASFNDLLLLDHPPDRSSWRIAPGYHIEPLDDLSQFHLDSATPDSMLEPSMAQRLNDGRNACFVARENGTLAGYIWFARRFIEASHNRGAAKHSGVAIQFPASLVFLYKAWVLPEHRGQGLFGALIGSSFDAWADHGISGILTTTEAINRPVHCVCRKLGFLRLGRYFRIGIGPLYCGISPHRTASPYGVTFGSRRSVSYSSASSALI